MKRCKARTMQSIVWDGGPGGGDFRMLRCGECSSSGNRAKTTRCWLDSSQERWMFCSECLPLDRICVCAHCVRFFWPCKGRRALHADRMQLNLSGNAPENRESRHPRVVTSGSALACLTPSREGSVQNRAKLLFEEAGCEISGEHIF